MKLNTGFTRIKVIVTGQYLRWALMSDRQQAESVRFCSEIVTHGLNYGIQDSI
ncbi:MAG: hypothetical protein KME25_09085 [Symplocastrum torsivum CPER-KK1]|uniref:Uncharacterized protein n=1 Tax=Symplocastrum torsivum CPER-KK1 TaxID=450513 RepID=A0A951PKK7_9CYAN|nr:hypothetical protein [Symplocastrum torsivum CPER-KK1]